MYSPVSDTIDSYFQEGETSGTTLKPRRSSTQSYETNDATRKTLQLVEGTTPPVYGHEPLQQMSQFLRPQLSTSSLNSSAGSSIYATPLSTPSIDGLNSDLANFSMLNPVGFANHPFGTLRPSSNVESSAPTFSPYDRGCLSPTSGHSSEHSRSSTRDRLSTSLLEPSAPSLRDRSRSPSPPLSLASSISSKVQSKSSRHSPGSYTPARSSPLLNSATLDFSSNPSSNNNVPHPGDSVIMNNKNSPQAPLGAWSAKKKKFMDVLTNIRSSKLSLAGSASSISSPSFNAANARAMGSVSLGSRSPQISSPVFKDHPVQLSGASSPIKSSSTEFLAVRSGSRLRIPSLPHQHSVSGGGGMGGSRQRSSGSRPKFAPPVD